MKELKIETKRGTLLDGVLFGTGGKTETVLICITGIHGNFYSNPFYYNIGNTLTAGGIDFIYAQTNDAFGAIRTQNVRIGQEVEQITHTGALLIGTYDNFTDGDPSGFLRNINSHMPTAEENRLLFIERTGHTYLQKQQELADKILQTILDWRK